MDLANAPDLADTHRSADPATDRPARVRLLDLEQAKMPAFQRQWQALAHASTEPNPYFEPWFLLPALAAFARGDAGRGPRPGVIAHHCAGELTGALPLVRSPRYYGYPLPHFATWMHANAFCGAPLVRPGHEERFWTALLEHLDANPGPALFLHLPQVPVEGALHRALAAVLARQGRSSATVACAQRAMLAAPVSAEAYLVASLSAKKRKELRRLHKRLSEEGALAFERREDSAALGQWIDEFLALEAAGWKGDAGSALANADGTRALFAAALTGAAREGKLERLALRLDGQPIAMLANFLCPPGAFSFKTAFDENYARFSPGMLLQLENLALLEREGIAWADSCAAEGHPMIEHLWRERRTLVGINIAIGGRLRRAAFDRLMAYETRKRRDP
jgi:CelD/BcsL family acetyltransferase involved in cellulose biosynthesis